MLNLSTKSLFSTLLVLVGAVSGCRESPQIAPMTGSVTLDGEPLKFGSIMMQPVEGGEPARAQIQPDGTFSMTTRGVGEGARLGLNRVRVACFAGQKGGGAVASDGELMLGRSLIPTRYNSFGSSGLTVEVLPEGNEPYHIELKKD